MDATDSFIKEGLCEQELRYLRERKEALKAEHAAYLQEHPELPKLLHGWVADVLAEKPKDVFLFSRHHFAAKINARHGVGPPLLVSGPPPLVVVSEKKPLLRLLDARFPGKFAAPALTTSRPPRRSDPPTTAFATRDTMRDDAAQARYLELGDDDSGELVGTTLEALARVRAHGRVPLLHLPLHRARQARQCPYVNAHCILVGDAHVDNDFFDTVISSSSDGGDVAAFVRAVDDIYEGT